MIHRTRYSQLVRTPKCAIWYSAMLTSDYGTHTHLLNIITTAREGRHGIIYEEHDTTKSPPLKCVSLDIPQRSIPGYVTDTHSSSIKYYGTEHRTGDEGHVGRYKEHEPVNSPAIQFVPPGNAAALNFGYGTNMRPLNIITRARDTEHGTQNIEHRTRYE